MEGQQPGFAVVLSGDGGVQLLVLTAGTVPRWAFGEGRHPGI